jgi:glycosyltransferase involved in cell wall biosynthesis
MLGGADSRNTPEIVYDRLETMLATASLISALRAAQEHRSGTARPAAHPQLLAQYDWVFIGSPGWLIAFGDRISQYGLDEHYCGGAIKWLGYVNEYQKAFLYRYAEMAIYPSFFEGFGIPAVEAMYFSCPVVCSYSSGIPEAGGDAAFYFDPTSLPSFEQTLSAALRRLRLERGAIARPAAVGPCVSPGTISPAGSTKQSPGRSPKVLRSADLEHSRDHRFSAAARRGGSSS